MANEYEVASFRPVKRPGHKVQVYTKDMSIHLTRDGAIREAKARSKRGDSGMYVLHWNGNVWSYIDWHHEQPKAD